jgi:pyruvate/2-oxoglutarate dehydrogenase complex dihydrolipoamide dehydrogenase (E3) component
MPGLDEVSFLTKASVLELDILPRHLIIVDGDYVGLEFAQMYWRFGGAVTVIENGPRLLRLEDEDVSAAVKDILETEESAFIFMPNTSDSRGGAVVADTPWPSTS